MRNALLVVVLPAEAFIAGRSLFRIVAQSAQVVGNGAGGLLIALTSPRGALLLDCVSFLRLGARRARGDAGARRRSRGEATARRAATCSGTRSPGMSAVLADRRIRRVLLLGWLVPTCAVAPEALAAPYVAAPRALRGRGRAGGSRRSRPARSRASWSRSGSCRPPGGCGSIGVLAAATFVPLLAFAGQPGLALALPLLVVSGLCSAWMLGQDALILEVTPEHLLGRVFSVNTAGPDLAAGPRLRRCRRARARSSRRTSRS